MRHINGIAGCKKGIGARELETKDEISVRIIDCADDHLALRIGTHNEGARLSWREAEHIATLLLEAAVRAKCRAIPVDLPPESESAGNSDED
jgi:hypothetical protein